MFSNNTSHNLVHLPRHQPPSAPLHPPPSHPPPPTPTADPQLPRGECRYILNGIEPDGSRQRCVCVTFILNKSIPGSMCGCGHQAWHHFADPAGKWTPVEDHVETLERVKRLEDINRHLHGELSKERDDRKKAIEGLYTALQLNYNNMGKMKHHLEGRMLQILSELKNHFDDNMKMHFDDKLETIIDATTHSKASLDTLDKKVESLDRSLQELEERVDSGRWPSRSATPAHEPQASSSGVQSQSSPKKDSLRTLTESRESQQWDIRVVLVPSKTQQFGFAFDSAAWRRCHSRHMHQDLHLSNHDSTSFVEAVESAFTHILQKRAWMPLLCFGSADKSLGQLPMDQRNHTLWDYKFIEKNCLAHDKMQGELVYIALQSDDLSWEQIHKLPAASGRDETCWKTDPDLDGKSNDTMDYKMDLVVKSLDSESVYEYSPPPYSSSRTHSDLDRLAMLAAQSPYLPKHPPSLSDRSSMSDRTSLSMSMAGSSLAGSSIAEDDEHKDKRARHGGLPHPSPSSSGGYYYSGRSKRKIAPNKNKEPFGPVALSEVKFPKLSGFHRRGHEPKDKSGVAQQQLLLQQQDQQDQEQSPQHQLPQPPQSIS